MGTRSTTKVFNEDKLVLALYKQYDGYPDCWGKELKNFLKSKRFVNGIPLGEQNVFNGICDFALQLVCKFKQGPGGLYATTEDDEQEYNYIIRQLSDSKGNPTKVILKCLEEPMDFELDIKQTSKVSKMKKSLMLLNENFESSIRTMETSQFSLFFNTFKREFKKLLKNYVSRMEFYKGHFELNGFFELLDGRNYYFSIGDVRFEPKSMLIRTANNFSDFVGGSNYEIDLNEYFEDNLFEYLKIL
jgi:hypothetical protein